MISARTWHETWHPHLHRNPTGDTAYTSTLDASRRSTTHTVTIKCDYVTQRTPAPTVDYIKCKYIGLITATHTGCPRRNVKYFVRVFLMLNYTDITQNTYIQSWTVTEIMNREKCGHLAFPRTVPLQLLAHYPLKCNAATPPSSHVTAWGAYVG